VSLSSPDTSKVFVVHGRNETARDAMFDFLRALGVQPIEWSQAVKLTGKGSPYIGEILDAAFAVAQAIVVLMTPDEVAYLRSEYASSDDDPETQPAAQARPNVLFEAGMALGRNPDRTILVELGTVRPFSDVAGRHALRLDGQAKSRKELAERLQTAGCAVDLTGSDWLSKGELVPPPPPGGGLPLGKKIPAQGSNAVRIDARYVDRGSSGRLQITNYSPFPVHDLEFTIPEEAKSFAVHAELPVAKLPSGKSVTFIASRFMGPGVDHFEMPITARTPDGDLIETSAFINLLG
jgi:hypothetical protein